MKKKKSGFTLVEMIIGLALSAALVGIIGTFFGVNSEINANTFIKSDLQSEAQQIQDRIMNFGMQAKEVSKVILQGGQSSNPKDNVKDTVYSQLSVSNNTPQITELEIVSLEEINGSITEVNYTLKYNKAGRTLTLKRDNGIELELSKNVESIEIKPGDINKTFSECDTLIMNVVLSQRKHEVKTDMTKVTSNIVIAFRNKM